MSNHHDHQSGSHHEHYIIPDAKIIKTLFALLFLTAVTVGLSYVHLGVFNFIVGMIVATIKAFLVASIFMNLSHDDASNSVIFTSGFLFLAIFIGLVAPDFFFRGDVSTAGKSLLLPVKGTSKFKRPWEPTPEIVAHGKAIFQQQCVSCHGDAGQGNGPAAGALVPPPRNFTQDAGWKIGRKPSQIFKTLKEGIPGGAMGSFATIPAEDRWTLSHFVASLGPNVLKDSVEDLKVAGVDPSKDTLGDAEAPSISVRDAMKILASESKKEGEGNLKPGNDGLSDYDRRLDARTFNPNP